MLYLTALCAGAGGAASLGLEWVDHFSEEESAQEATGENDKERKLDTLALITWASCVGALVFVTAQAIGFWVVRNSADEDDPFPALWNLLIAAILAAVVGGLFGAMIVG